MAVVAVTDNALDEAKSTGWVVESRPKTPAPPRSTPAPRPMTTGTPTPWDVVYWLQSQDIVPLPCQPKTKRPISRISSYGIYGKNAPEGDSFHIPTPERVPVVRSWWKNEEYHRHATVKDCSISVPLHPDWHGGRQVIVLDIDEASLCDAVASAPYLAQCPVGAGKKGSKLFAILDNAGGRPENAITQYYPADDPDHPALEVFVGGKHALIYGEHPDSTSEHPIFYAVTRGFGDPFPVLSWAKIEEALEPVIQDNDLVLKTRGERERVEPMPVCPRPRNSQSITDQLGLSITNLCILTDGVKVGDEIRGSHPVHGSTTGQNVTINPHKNTWHCHRCGTGGGPVEWISIEDGIIDCSQSKPGCLEGHWPEVFDALRKRGYDTDMLVSPGKGTRSPPFSSLSPEEKYLRRVEYRRKIQAARRQEAQA